MQVLGTRAVDEAPPATVMPADRAARVSAVTGAARPVSPPWQSRQVSMVGISRSSARSDRSAAWQVLQGVGVVPCDLWSKRACGILLSGSPLFSGGAGSGQSEIRRWILEHDQGSDVQASALYNLGNVQGSLGDWAAARANYAAASLARPGFAMARASEALAAFQLGDLDTAEQQLRSIIRRYPLFADARAGLTALLWQRGGRGEAESNWVAASGLDPRYRDPEWLLTVRRWPPAAVAALQQFLALN